MVPNTTVGTPSSFVNFMTLAESVALAPMFDFWTSLSVFSFSDADGLNLLAPPLCGLLVLWSSTYMLGEVTAINASPLKLMQKWYLAYIIHKNVRVHTSMDFWIWSLEPASFCDKLLAKVGDRIFGSSSGSALLVSNTLPGILRPLSNLNHEQR